MSVETDYIAEAITEAFGERCPDFAEGCACCEAWAQYDRLGEENSRLLAVIKKAENDIDMARFGEGYGFNLPYVVDDLRKATAAPQTAITEEFQQNNEHGGYPILVDLPGNVFTRAFKRLRRALSKAGEMVKIGKAVNVEKRLRGIQTASPVVLHLVRTIESDDGNRLELELHRRFAQYRENGEWFRLEGALSEWVAERCPI